MGLTNYKHILLLLFLLLLLLYINQSVSNGVGGRRGVDKSDYELLLSFDRNDSMDSELMMMMMRSAIFSTHIQTYNKI